MGLQVFDTPDSIEAFRLLAIRGRLKLELRGIRFRINTFQAVRKEFGWTDRSRQVILDKYEAMLRERGILSE